MNTPRAYGPLTVEERFFVKVDIVKNGCWLWIPTHRDRSGRPRYRQMGAAKWAYIHFKGDLPAGTETTHTCLDKNCVNPDHLIAATHKENMQMGPQRGPDKKPRKPGRWL